MALLCDAAERDVGSPAGGSVVSSLGGAAGLLKGGELATAMCAHARHGDPVVLALMRRVLRPVCAPILIHIQRWISDGELEDPWGEFFIRNDAAWEDHNWEEKYKLRLEMLPSFVSEELANKILQIGKSINFMRKCCREVRFESRSPHLTRRITSIEYGQWEDLEEIVGALAGEANNALVAGLLGKYDLMWHCRAMKRFILFGQGDFVRHLLDLIADSARPGGAQLYHHNFTGIVETAIRASVAPSEEAQIRNRVGVSKFDNSREGDEFISAFSLEYKVDSPLNAIITDDAMRKYKRIFNFLWGIKRVEQALSTSWHRASGLAGIGTNRVLAHGQDRGEHKKLQQFALGVVYGASNLGIQHQMMHFISNLQYYVMFEVIECSWAEFEAEMLAAKDLDQLISAQNRLLDLVLERVLLVEAAEEQRRQMEKVFKSILDYCLAHQQLCEVTEQALARRGAISRSDEEAVLEKRWGVDDPDAGQDDDDDGGELGGGMRPPRALTGKIAVKTAEFVEAFGHLREMLESTTSADLRSLTFRLDFSEFYSSSSAARP
ncbi:Spc98 family-domain-containing protein [Baffinella frigidus]|nr:Spc98 family-domain-containing protein [Cryptophyta sp. CCMP2293]